MASKVKPAGSATVNPGVAPPPFFLAGEIRLSLSFAAAFSIVLGAGVLGIFLLLFPPLDHMIPSLLSLMVVSVGSGCLYLVVRFAAYWTAWFRVSRKYPLVGTVHPAARGELPRDHFLFVLSAPTALLIPTWGVLAGKGWGATPELWLSIAVVGGIALRDLRAAWRLLFLDPACWVKETRLGLEILKRVGAG